MTRLIPVTALIAALALPQAPAPAEAQGFLNQLRRDVEEAKREFRRKTGVDIRIERQRPVREAAAPRGPIITRESGLVMTSIRPEMRPGEELRVESGPSEAEQRQEALLAEARAAEEAGPGGPLWGLPMAVKDLTAVKGIRSTWGSPIFADHVPEADDPLPARLRAAGAILIGKTNVPEFGLGSHSYNPIFGVTRNPYGLSRSAGGSSGGAAVALATPC